MGAKEANRTSFKKGEAKGRPYGTKNKKTKLLEATGLTLSNDIHSFMDGIGFERFIEQMGKLKGYAYTQTYLGLLEYVKPKLSRMEVVKEEEKLVINIFGSNQQTINHDFTEVEEIKQIKPSAKHEEHEEEIKPSLLDLL